MKTTEELRDEVAHSNKWFERSRGIGLATFGGAVACLAENLDAHHFSAPINAAGIILSVVSAVTLTSANREHREGVAKQMEIERRDWWQQTRFEIKPQVDEFTMVVPQSVAETRPAPESTEAPGLSPGAGDRHGWSSF